MEQIKTKYKSKIKSDYSHMGVIFHAKETNTNAVNERASYIINETFIMRIDWIEGIAPDRN